ncbi:hypothetical protein [Kutzneria sp. NPDC051319]|uniref:hypothetical protein n=1 Tax=Kutzneria sp. NPDC051319 TaxID=3155047 RepID=UPI0034272ECC
MTDERPEVSALQFSHPTPGAPLMPTDAHPCAPVRFLAPADDDVATTAPRPRGGHAG